MFLFKQGLYTALPDFLFNFNKLDKDHLGKPEASLADRSHLICFKGENYGNKKQKMAGTTV